jgi:cytochrome P450
MPAFSFRHIKNLYPIFWSKAREVTDAMIADVHKQSGTEDEGVVEVGGWASRVTLDIIGVAGIGHDFNAIENPDSELNTCYRTIFSPNRGVRLLELAGLILPGWFLRNLPVKQNRQLQAARSLVRRTCFDLVHEKREKLENGKSTGTDILSVAMESGGFSDEDMVNQLMTFLAAGHETTASAMMWAIYLLCRNPDVQTRLREDVRAGLPGISDATSTVDSAEVDKISYLHAVCNEVFRLTPPVSLTLRTTANDSTILNQPIPKGTTIILSPQAVNLNPQLWGEDAGQFNPERWMGPGRANSGGADSNYSMLTFLHGPRSCIGKDFAKAEFAVLLAAWVGRFEMEFEDKDYELVIGGGITSKPKGGLSVRIKALEGW